MAMDKVFYTSDGKLYKSKIRKENSDAEMNFPTGDMLKALSDTPITREEMITKINQPEFPNITAVLAPVRPPEVLGKNKKLN